MNGRRMAKECGEKKRKVTIKSVVDVVVGLINLAMMQQVTSELRAPVVACECTIGAR